MILLDTHILLWIAEDDPRIGAALRSTLNEAALHHELFLSPISVWEIALKNSRGRLHLHRPLRLWVRQTMQRANLQLAPITADIACECAELPTVFHGDPADRLIVATARVENMQLVTADTTLLALAEQGYFQAITL